VRNADITLFIKRHVNGVWRGDKQERVAVRGGARDRLQSQIAATARPIVNDDGVAEPLRQRLTDKARADVRRAAGGNEDDQRHRPRRIGSRPRKPRHGRQCGSARVQMQKISAGKFHFEPSSLFTSHAEGLDSHVESTQNTRTFDGPRYRFAVASNPLVGVRSS